MGERCMSASFQTPACTSQSYSPSWSSSSSSSRAVQCFSAEWRGLGPDREGQGSTRERRVQKLKYRPQWGRAEPQREREERGFFLFVLPCNDCYAVETHDSLARSGDLTYKKKKKPLTVGSTWIPAVFRTNVSRGSVRWHWETGRDWETERGIERLQDWAGESFSGVAQTQAVEQCGGPRQSPFHRLPC